MKRTKILRYPADRWPLSYTFMVLAVQLGLFFGVENLWILALCVILFQPVQAVKNFAGHLTWTIALGQRYPKVYRRLKIMTAVSLATLSVLIYLDPAKAMIVFVGPMLLAIFNVARLGYVQYAGLDLDDHFGASRNIESRLYNLVTFNSGYHTAHHVKPGLHWSRLPEFHRQLRDRIPAELR